MSEETPRILDVFLDGSSVTVRDVRTTLVESGWQVAGSNPAAGWTQWSRAELTAYEQKYEDLVALEFLVRIEDPDDEDDQEELYEEFEQELESVVTALTERLGPAALTSHFDEPALPVPGQFDKGYVWEAAPWRIMATLQQEDKELPIRVSVWLVGS